MKKILMKIFIMICFFGMSFMFQNTVNAEGIYSEWSDWSDWSKTQVTETDTRDVDTKVEREEVINYTSASVESDHYYGESVISEPSCPYDFTTLYETTTHAAATIHPITGKGYVCKTWDSYSEEQCSAREYFYDDGYCAYYAKIDETCPNGGSPTGQGCRGIYYYCTTGTLTSNNQCEITEYVNVTYYRYRTRELISDSTTPDDETTTTPDDDTTTTGTIKVSVLDNETNKAVSGVVLKVCDTKDCKKVLFERNTSSFNVGNISLGTYYLVIDSVPEGYVKPKTIEFKLDKDNLSFDKTIKLEKQTKVPDTLSNFSKVIIICGLVGMIAGISLLYFNAKKEEEI